MNQKIIDLFERDYMFSNNDGKPSTPALYNHIREACHLDVAKDILGSELFFEFQPLIPFFFVAPFKF